MVVNFIKFHPAASIPVRGSKYAAGYDLSACIDTPVLIAPHETVKIGTGLVIEPPTGHFGAIFARSGMATKRGLRPSNCVGICDEDYRGEYIVALHNDSNTHQTVQPGERIAQLVFLPYNDVTFVEQTSLSETDRGSDGFGSTGTK